jgi:membrane protein
MSLVETTREVVTAVREENVPFKAASIAYYSIASFVPLLVLGLALLSVFGAADLVVDVLRSNLSSSGVTVLDRVLTDTSGRSVAGVLGFLFTLWSASKVFRGLSIAFEELYDGGSDLSLVGEVLKSVLAFATLLVAILLLSATSVVLATTGIPIPSPALVGNVVAIVVLAVLFLPLYYVLPPVSITVRHALPGTILAAIGWVVLQVAFFYYTQTGGGYSAYGLLGAVLLFITFLYFASNVLLIGAVVNATVDAG